jgi:hypothetical protein
MSALDSLLGGAPSAALDIVADEGLPPPLYTEAEDEDCNPLCAALPAKTCTPLPSPRVVLLQSISLPRDGRTDSVAEHDPPTPSFAVAMHDSTSAVTALADAAAGAIAAAFPPWLADLLGGPPAPDPAACAVWHDADWAAGAGTLFLDGVALRVREGTVYLEGVALAEPDPAHGLLRCRCDRRVLIACTFDDAAAVAEWATVCRDCGRWTAGPAGAGRGCDVEVLF